MTVKNIMLDNDAEVPPFWKMSHTEFYKLYENGQTYEYIRLCKLKQTRLNRQSTIVGSCMKLKSKILLDD